MCVVQNFFSHQLCFLDANWVERHIKKENRKARCWYWWWLRNGILLMPFLLSPLRWALFSWAFCIAPKHVRRFWTERHWSVCYGTWFPLCPSSAVTVPWSWDPGMMWQVLTPFFASYPERCLNYSSAQSQLLWAALWDRCAVVPWKTAALQHRTEGCVPKAGSEASPLVPCICFCCVVSLFACRSPNSARSDYM